MSKKEPIRVLEVFHKMDRGGAETFIMNVYRHLDRSKVQLDFVVSSKDKGDYDEEIFKLGGKIYYIPSFKGYNFFSYCKQFKKLLKEHPEYHIVHGHAQGAASIYLVLAKQEKRYTICHSHNTMFDDGIIGVIKKIMQFPIRYIADELFACSNAAAYALYGNVRVEKNLVHIVPNSVDVDYLLKCEGSEKLKEKYDLTGKYVIGHVGRFVSAKNHHFLIEVYKEVVKQKPNAILLLLGRGELEEEIKEMVRNYQLDNNVRFMGVREDALTLLKVMDIFAFPSLYEGLPLSVIEAQIAGVKCILSNQITEEVKISNKTIFLGLNEKEKWINEILTPNEEKPLFSEKMEQYRSDNTVSLLTHCYLSFEEKYNEQIR